MTNLHYSILNISYRIFSKGTKELTNTLKYVLIKTSNDLLKHDMPLINKQDNFIRIVCFFCHLLYIFDA